MDLIEDDLPNNLDYLDATAQRAKGPAGGDPSEGLRSWQTEEEDILRDDLLASEMNGETIKILMQGPFDLQGDYWETLPSLEGDTSSE